MSKIRSTLTKAVLTSLFAIAPMGAGALFADTQPVESIDTPKDETSSETSYYTRSEESYVGGGRRHHRGYYRGQDGRHYYKYSPYNFNHPYRPNYHRPYHYSRRPYWYYYNW